VKPSPAKTPIKAIVPVLTKTAAIKEVVGAIPVTTEMSMIPLNLSEGEIPAYFDKYMKSIDSEITNSFCEIPVMIKTMAFGYESHYM